MKIIILNGSHRKNGATALILNEMYQKQETYPNVEAQLYNVADFNLKFCVGCCKCYKNGKCFLMMILKNYQKVLKQQTALL